MAKKDRKKKKILTQITIRLLLVVVMACMISIICTIFLLSERTKKDALDLVTQNVVDVVKETASKADTRFLNKCSKSMFRW